MYLWESSLQGNIFFTKKQRSVLHYYKNPKPSEIKVRIIYPNSGTLELWKFSNFTFEGYLAGTTPVLFVRFSSSLLCRSCLGHVRTVRLTNNFFTSSSGIEVQNTSKYNPQLEVPISNWEVPIGTSTMLIGTNCKMGPDTFCSSEISSKGGLVKPVGS